jgi:hypothetical protein
MAQAKTQLNTAERIARVNLFTRSVKKKILAGAAGLTPEEIEATKFVASVVGSLSDSWKKSGRGRDVNPSRDALYLRVHRAGKALESAKLAGAGRSDLRRYREAFDAATADYEKFKAAKSNGGGGKTARGK